MSLNKTLKKTAKTALKGFWMKAALVTAVVLIFESAVTFLEGVFLTICEHFGVVHFLDQNIFVHFHFSAETVMELSVALVCGIISLVFIAPVIIGEIRWQCKVFSKTPVKIREVFYFFKSPRLYFKSVWLTLSVALQRLWWGILIFLIPTTAFAFSSVLLKSSSLISHGFGIVALVIGSGFLAVGIFFFLKVYFAFSLATHVLAEDENVRVRECIKISKSSMKNNEAKYLILKLSLLPWLLLESLIIPMLFVMPYYHACHVAFARRFLKEHKMKQEHNMA